MFGKTKIKPVGKDRAPAPSGEGESRGGVKQQAEHRNHRQSHTSAPALRLLAKLSATGS